MKSRFLLEDEFPPRRDATRGVPCSKGMSQAEFVRQLGWTFKNKKEQSLTARSIEYWITPTQLRSNFTSIRRYPGGPRLIPPPGIRKAGDVLGLDGRVPEFIPVHRPRLLDAKDRNEIIAPQQRSIECPAGGDKLLFAPGTQHFTDQHINNRAADAGKVGPGPARTRTWQIWPGVC